MHEWTWRPLSDLPPADLPKGKKAQEALAASEAVYERLLARQPARLALEQLRGPFEYVADRLEDVVSGEADPMVGVQPGDADGVVGKRSDHAPRADLFDADPSARPIRPAYGNRA